MSNCLKTLDLDEPYSRKYLESIIHLDLEELEVLRDIYENFMDNFQKELLIMDHVIAFKKTSLGLALC